MNKKISEPQKKPILDVWSGRSIFPVPAQSAPTEVVVKEGIVWRMGVEPSFGGDSCFLRGFDIRHAEVIFTLINYYRNKNIPLGEEISLPYSNLLELVGWQQNQLHDLYEVIGDLNNIWTKVKSSHGYQCFRVLSISESAPVASDDFMIDRVIFHPAFLEILDFIENDMSIRIDVFNSIPSKIAKAIYLYLPTRAINCTKENPFRISLTDLFTEIGIPHEENKANYMREVMDFL